MVNVTIGQYYPTTSYIHSLDPRTKLMSTFVYIAMLFMARSVYGFLACAFFLGIIIYASNVPFKYIIRGLRSIIFIVLFTAVINIFFTPGKTVLFTVFSLTITLEGVLTALTIAVRLVLLICGSSILTLTTSPISLTDAMEFFLKPLKKIGVPAHEIAMMMSIALRFIPTLLEELEKIMKAQKARGADFESSTGLVKKAKSLIPLLVPLFVSAFRCAIDLAMAMEARCYRGDINRTKMKQMKLLLEDYIAVMFMGVYVLVGGLVWYFL